MTEAEVRTAITEAGPVPTLSNGTWKVPMNDTVNIYIKPSACKEETGKCRIFTAYVNFQSELPKAQLLGFANDHNNASMVSRAVVDGKNVFLQYPIVVSNGAGAEFFKARLTEFPQLLEIFLQKVHTPAQKAASGS